MPGKRARAPFCEIESVRVHASLASVFAGRRQCAMFLCFARALQLRALLCACSAEQHPFPLVYYCHFFFLSCGILLSFSRRSQSMKIQPRASSFFYRYSSFTLANQPQRNAARPALRTCRMHAFAHWGGTTREISRRVAALPARGGNSPHSRRICYAAPSSTASRSMEYSLTLLLFK